MKFIITFFLVCSSFLYGISIYDIQYTTSPAGGTYPSLYEGQVVTTGGIVTGTDYSNGRFFISSSSGGAWQGIYIYDNDQTVAVGDSVIINGEVVEYYGFTEIGSLNSFQLISSGNTLPAASAVSTLEAATEAYESVLIEINNVEVTQGYDEWNEWRVNDGSGDCTISIGFIDLTEIGIPILLNYPFSSITGIVSYTWENFQLNPRTLNDLYAAPESYIISIPEQYIFSPLEFEIPIYLSFLGETQQVQDYQFTLEYDHEVMIYSGYNTENTLSNTGSITVVEPSSGILELQFTGSFSFSGIQTLINLEFTGVETGSSAMEFSMFALGGINIEYFLLGEIYLQMESIPIGDTLTVIQRPIQNIPQITIPNEEFIIECLAGETTTGWSAELIHSNKVISLNISETFYDPDLDRWKLTASAPTPDIYELYDLVVSADGIVTDTTKSAVHLIPERKTEYCFIHITDSHLPTHIFYPDPASLTDTTEVEDLREVIKDINLINPEFVLFTGDLVNEGEMEDFENRRVYTKAQKLLEEFEVPVYLTSGNHDIGGWDSSPPPQGTARHNWWNFFGWNWLQNPPPADPYYTQNYSFDYGPIHFIGMEAYLNYDSYMQNIYGDESFTDMQMQWLENDLILASGSESQVLFYHYDFSEQIDLDDMGIEMALWGHIHSNSGNITSPPFNLATESTCDGERAYRVINVNDGTLEPTNTIYAGWNGDELIATFTPENNGSTDSLFCYIENSQNLNFADAQLNFIMPVDAEEYIVYNGTLNQIDDSGEFAVCYISIDITANGNTSVSVVADFDASAKNQLMPQDFQLTNYPNPFNPSTIISFSLTSEITEDTELSIYNLKGQKVKDLLIDKSTNSPVHQAIWDGTDDNDMGVSSGIYFIKLKSRNIENSKKIILLK